MFSRLYRPYRKYLASFPIFIGAVLLVGILGLLTRWGPDWLFFVVAIAFLGGVWAGGRYLERHEDGSAPE